MPQLHLSCELKDLMTCFTCRNVENLLTRLKNEREQKKPEMKTISSFENIYLIFQWAKKLLVESILN